MSATTKPTTVQPLVNRKQISTLRGFAILLYFVLNWKLYWPSLYEEGSTVLAQHSGSNTWILGAATQLMVKPQGYCLEHTQVQYLILIYSSSQIFKYTKIQVLKYSSTQIFKCSNIQVLKYSSTDSFCSTAGWASGILQQQQRRRRCPWKAFRRRPVFHLTLLRDTPKNAENWFFNLMC